MNRHAQRSEETRGRLLKAAEECFARSGYDGTGVAEICQAAGVSKGAFYHHFATKQDIFLALLTRWLAALEQSLGGLRDRAASVPEALQAMTGVVSGILTDAGDRLPIYLEYLSQARRDPAVWRATIEPYRRFRDFFAEVIERGIREGSLRPVNSRSAARALVSMAIGLLLQALLDVDERDHEQVWAESLQFALDSIRTR
jgi:AcrR family transcriptional regulator